MVCLLKIVQHDAQPILVEKVIHMNDQVLDSWYPQVVVALPKNNIKNWTKNKQDKITINQGFAS